jgi:toxin ParE1/3/4
MNLPIVLRAEAEAEFDEAFDFYESRQAGLGADFVAEVQKVFDRLVTNPLVHQVSFADIRKAIVRRFPYCVYYRPHADPRSLPYSIPAAILRSGRIAPDHIRAVDGLPRTANSWEREH